jgi:ADP-ribosylglycohydrolase
VSPEDYYNHCTGSVPAGTKTSLVPPELTAKVSLYQRVDLSYQSIVELPASLPLTLPHLTCLYLSHNNLTSLPVSIHGFLHLQDLDVSHNEISDLPETFTALNNLKKFDISHNILSVLPVNVDQLIALEKINVSHNKLEHLPIAMGNLPKLRILLANKNQLGAAFEQLCLDDECSMESSLKLLQHLRSCYHQTQKGEQLAAGNIFSRERGTIFDSKILNSGSAQSFFTQIQTQAVNTGNRILTPLIPPPGSTKRDTDALKDGLLGMFYGAAIGDALGVFTESMSPSQAEFYYEKDNFLSNRFHIDEYRCHYEKGDITVASSIVISVLDSVMSWGGVVDELDYAKKLHQLISTSTKPLVSPVLQGVTNKSNFMSDPKNAAKEWNQQKLGQSRIVYDSYCLPAMIGLVIAQFHNTEETCANARRICGATHSGEENLRAAEMFVLCLARLIKGESLSESVTCMTEELNANPRQSSSIENNNNNNAITTSSPLVTLQTLAECVEIYKKQGFKEAMLNVVLKGRNSSTGSQLVGSVLGLQLGFTELPQDLIAFIQPAFRKQLDKKMNTLFDVMGIP